MKDRLLEPLCKRWPWFAAIMRVQDRFTEVHGGNLAASITLAAFTSIFPMLLLLVSVIGFLSIGSAADLPARIISRLGLTGEAANAVISAVKTAERSRGTALGVGTIGLLWSSLGLVDALQYAMDSVWQVSGRGLKDKLRGLAWLGGTVVLLGTSFGVIGLLSISPWLAPVSIVAGLLMNLGLWLWTLKMLLNVEVPWRALLLGAAVGAVGLEVLKLLGSIYLPRLVASSSALYGTIGVVFAILAWLFFFGRLVVYVAVVAVVRWEQHHGTARVELEVPKIPDVVAVEATRSGQTKEPVKSG